MAKANSLTFRRGIGDSKMLTSFRRIAFSWNWASFSRNLQTNQNLNPFSLNHAENWQRDNGQTPKILRNRINLQIFSIFSTTPQEPMEKGWTQIESLNLYANSE